MSDVIRLRGVNRIFGEGHTSVIALRPTDLTVAAGELVAVMGPSGSGKTTLLALVGGLDKPTGGSITVLDHDLQTMRPRGLARLRRRSIGYVFQDLNLLPALTAVENVMLPLELEGVRTREARGTALSALADVGLDDVAERFPDDLSGGERQRVAIARAMVGPRSVLLADEPTGALDTLTGETVMRLLRTHCDRGGTALLVTHEVTHASWADRVIFLRDGRIVDQAESTEVPTHLSAAAQVGSEGER